MEKETHLMSLIAVLIVGTLLGVTEEQSASTEEIASSRQSLANLAGDLQTAVVKFRV